MKTARPISLRLENSRNPCETLTVSYTNWGEPYDEGTQIKLEEQGNWGNSVTVSLTLFEVEELAEFLPKLLAQIKGK